MARAKRKAQPAIDYDQVAVERAIQMLYALAADDGHAQTLREAVMAAGRLGHVGPARDLLAALRRASAALSDIGLELFASREDLTP